MVLDLYKHIHESGQSCNKIGRTRSVLSFPARFPTNVLLQLRVILERVVLVVSECCINMFYKRVVRNLCFKYRDIFVSLSHFNFYFCLKIQFLIYPNVSVFWNN